MDKQAARQVFEQIAACLELLGENPFRVRAFANAARAIANFPGELAEGLRSGELAEVRGLGDASLDIVRELVERGRSSVLDELRERVPPGLVEMLHIPGLGVAKVQQIHDRLGVETLADLESAATDGRLAALPRFGAKTAEKIRRGIAYLRRSSEFRLFHHAQGELLGVQQALAALKGVLCVESAGSVRRRRELIRDLDVVVSHESGARDALVKQLGAAPGVIEFAGQDSAVTLRFVTGTVVDVFLSTAEDFGSTWVRATGSQAHLEQLQARARARGVELGPGGRFPDEASVYAALGLPWIPPELREGTGEIDAAERGRLPCLVEQRDLKGFVHCHTNYSDGTLTIAEWARACRDAGYEWIGITDHSQSSAYSGGLRAEDVARQHAEIDDANRELGGGGFRVLKGVEADILADGTLDFPDEVLAELDVVLAAVHSRFKQSHEEMTARICRALENPHVRVLVHPTGRLLGSREPYDVDLEQVFATAARNGKAVEINGSPYRLDLKDVHARRARDLGLRLAVDTDTHYLSELANIELGVATARRAWVGPDQVVNALPLDAFLAWSRRAG
jgi:DNA polymerase (family 10)